MSETPQRDPDQWQKETPSVPNAASVVFLCSSEAETRVFILFCYFIYRHRKLNWRYSLNTRLIRFFPLSFPQLLSCGCEGLRLGTSIHYQGSVQTPLICPTEKKTAQKEELHLNARISSLAPLLFLLLPFPRCSLHHPISLVQKHRKSSARLSYRLGASPLAVNGFG